MGITNNKKRHSFNINFNLNYVLIGLIFILILGSSIFYFLYFKLNKTIPILDIMAFFTGSVAILTLIYHSLSLENNSKFHKEKIILQKNEYSYKVASKFNEPNNLGVDILQKLKREKEGILQEKKIKEFIGYLKDNPEDNTSLVKLLNYFEYISILVCNNHINEKIIKLFFKTLFTSTYSLLKFYIDERQLVHRRSWINFEELSNKWREEK